ncbi:glutamate--cysteine ligase [Prauserella rugosa]|uniref:Glutamate--cysteine ligase EgtA n=1 Tax=Prauserella rugosa TaxID=43354 RepID=A0A660C6S1_9PSEU|nr:glutamate--cysteine ligase [Prauserella rugosa]
MTAMHGPVSPSHRPSPQPSRSPSRAPSGPPQGKPPDPAVPAEPDTSARDHAARVIADRAEGEAYVASVCFKHGPPRLVGVELEHLVHDHADPAAPVDPERLRRALGNHAPPTLARTVSADPTRPAAPAVPAAPHPPPVPLVPATPAELPAGSALSVEPGGQVEISTRPHPTLGGLIAAADSDLDHVTAALAGEGLVLGAAAIDPVRRPRRVLDTERYAAMERRFAARGSGGITMMCSTAAVQVCLDAGAPEQLPARWAALHALGPVLLALFANSSRHAGRDTGHASARWLSVMDTEPARTRPGSADHDPAVTWARRVLDTPLMVRRRPEGPWDAPGRLTFADWIARRGAARGWPPPTVGDLDYHLTTLFTPVRPRGHLEVRYLDAQPPGRWVDPVAVLAALLHRPATTDRVLDLCESVDGRWDTAARRGLADPDLARVAAHVVELGCTELGGLGLAPRAVDEITTAVHARLARPRLPHQRPAGNPARRPSEPESPSEPGSASGSESGSQPTRRRTP